MKGRHVLLIFMVLLLCVSKQTYCQVTVGIRASLNIASVKFQNFGDDAISRFGGGITSEVTLSDKLFLRPELMYSIKGWKGDGVSMSLHYLNVPVLVGYRPIPRFSLLAGPEFGYLLKRVRKPTYSGLLPDYEKFDYGIAFGSAYSITEKLSVELRYTYGFDTLIKATTRDLNNATTGVARDGANRVLQFSLLYFLTAGSDVLASGSQPGHHSLGDFGAHLGRSRSNLPGIIG